MERKVSDLTKEIKHLQKSKGTGLEEYNARKLYDENEFLKAQLDRTSRRYMYTVKKLKKFLSFSFRKIRMSIYCIVHVERKFIIFCVLVMSN